MIKLLKGKKNNDNGILSNSHIILSNSYIIDNIVIDAPENLEPPSNIVKLIITHEHCDHFIGADNFNCKKYSHPFTKDSINNKKDECCLCKYVGYKFPNIKIDYELKDGETIENLKVFYTPGHSKGSICLYEPNKKILFSGDTVFSNYNLPRTDLLTSEPDKLLDSYEKLSNLEIDIIYPGHGEKIKEKDYIKKLIQFLQ